MQRSLPTPEIRAQPSVQKDEWDMTGKIIIVGNAIVNTGMVDDAGNVLSNRIGYIGDGQDSTIIAVRDIISLDRT